MVSWYYVDGQERVGPISETEIITLINSSKLNEDSFVWRKGFTSWEKLKNVIELQELIQKNSSDSNKNSSFEFDKKQWRNSNQDDYIFFLKVGKDRKSEIDQIYGPYNSEEVNEAINDQRVNERSFIFSLGMDDWKPLSIFDLFKSDTGLEASSLIQFTESQNTPAYFIFKNKQNICIGIFRKIMGDTLEVLIDQNMAQDELIVDLYHGEQLIKAQCQITLHTKKKFYQTAMISISQVKNLLSENEWKKISQDLSLQVNGKV